MTPETWLRIENAIRWLSEGQTWDALSELAEAASIEGELEVADLAQRAMLQVTPPWK